MATDKTYRERVNVSYKFMHTTSAAAIASEADAELAACRARIAELEAALRRLHDWSRTQWSECLFTGDHPIAAAREALNSTKEST